MTGHTRLPEAKLGWANATYFLKNPYHSSKNKNILLEDYPIALCWLFGGQIGLNTSVAISIDAFPPAENEKKKTA